MGQRPRGWRAAAWHRRVGFAEHRRDAGAVPSWARGAGGSTGRRGGRAYWMAELRKQLHLGEEVVLVGLGHLAVQHRLDGDFVAPPPPGPYLAESARAQPRLHLHVVDANDPLVTLLLLVREQRARFRRLRHRRHVRRRVDGQDWRRRCRRREREHGQFRAGSRHLWRRLRFLTRRRVARVGHIGSLVGEREAVGTRRDEVKVRVGGGRALDGDAVLPRRARR